MATITSHRDVVIAVKQQLTAAGVPLTGPCGAFEITKRVAWILRGESAGLIAKQPQQNGCDWKGARYGTDIVIYPDGTHYDILVNAETENVPAWNMVTVSGAPFLRPELYRVALDPGDAPIPPEPPTPPTPIPVLPKKIALRSVVNGKLVTMWDAPHNLVANRDDIGPGEQFEIIILE